MSFDAIWKIVNEDGIVQDAIESVVEIAEGAGDSAQADIRRIGSRVMRNIVKAKLQGDTEWESDLIGQVSGLAEIQRLRAVHVKEEVLIAALRIAATVAARIATRMATGGLVG